jgi:hypothetical protein
MPRLGAVTLSPAAATAAAARAHHTSASAGAHGHALTTAAAAAAPPASCSPMRQMPPAVCWGFAMCYAVEAALTRPPCLPAGAGQAVRAASCCRSEGDAASRRR